MEAYLEDNRPTLDEICESVVQSGVCPHACDICAWNILVRVKEDKE